MYVPEEWYKLVRDCRRANAFHVEEMKQGDFVSLKTLTENIVNRKVTVNKRKVDWFSMRWIRVTQDKPFAFKYRCSLNDLEQWKEVDVKRRQRGRPVDMGRVTLPPLYTQSRPIKKAKLDDLMALLSYIPPVYHSFYESLQDDEAGTDSEAENDFESEEESPEDD